MPMKWKLKFTSCPIGKWGKLTSKDQHQFIKDLKNLLEKTEPMAALPDELVRSLYSFHNITHGSKKKTSGCGPCVANVERDLRTWLDKVTG